MKRFLTNARLSFLDLFQRRRPSTARPLEDGPASPPRQPDRSLTPDPVGAGSYTRDPVYLKPRTVAMLDWPGGGLRGPRPRAECGYLSQKSGT